MTCLHLDFCAEVDVFPLSDGPIVHEKAPDRYSAELTITCAKCGEPFQFLGPDVGLSMERPAVSVDATKLYLPIAPGRRTSLPSRVSFQLPPRGPKS